MSASLYCVAGPYAGQEFPLDETGIVFGRDPSSVNVVLESPQVSRSHLRVYAAGGGVVLEDLNSSNGTFLMKNGSASRITGLVTLSNGDVFSVGSGANYVFEARCVDQPADEPRTAAVPPPLQPAGEPRAEAAPRRLQRADPPLWSGIQMGLPAHITEGLLATRTSRFFAMLIDGAVFLAILIPLSLFFGAAVILGGLASVFLSFIPIIGPFLLAGTAAITYAPLFAVNVLYLLVNIYFLHKDGQTLGKKAMGIYIAGMNAQKAPIINIVLLRMIAMNVLVWLPFVGWIINIVNICFIARADRRMLHDLLAGTVVLKK